MATTYTAAITSTSPAGGESDRGGSTAVGASPTIDASSNPTRQQVNPSPTVSATPRAVAPRSGGVVDPGHDATIRPALPRKGPYQDPQVTNIGRPFEPREGPTADEGLTYGIKVPSGYSAVEVAIVDPNGQPITDLKYITASGLLSILSRVREGSNRARLWLRSAEYTDFVGIAARDVNGDGAVDYAWYSSAEKQEPINPIRDDTGVIVLERQELKGMWSGSGGVDFGGQLG